jgi:site-specific DNA-methyltransferase (adenine-specific)/modification methylase
MKLLLGDCLDKLKELEDNSVDCIITDPPYGTNDKYGKLIKRGNYHTSFNVISWDKEIPTEFLKEVFRVMKDDTWGFIFTDKKEITTMWNKLEEFGFSPRNTFYWIKTNKAPTMRKNFKSSVETAIVFTKGRTTIKWVGGGNQNNYFESPFVMGKEKVDHPTQKPVKLIKHIMGLITNEGDIVLDPFMGSGTTGVAAIELGRDFIGMEIDEVNINIAKDRIVSSITSNQEYSNTENTLLSFFE